MTTKSKNSSSYSSDGNLVAKEVFRSFSADMNAVEFGHEDWDVRYIELVAMDVYQVGLTLKAYYRVVGDVYAL